MYQRHLNYTKGYYVYLYLQTSIMLLYFISYGLQNQYLVTKCLNVIVIVALIEITVLLFFYLLKNVLLKGLSKEFAVSAIYMCLAELTAAVNMFISEERNGYLLIFLLVAAINYGLINKYGFFWISRLRNKILSIRKRSLLIVTFNEMTRQATEEINSRDYRNYHIAGVAVIDKDFSGRTIDGVNVVACKDTVTEYVCREWVDEVLIDFPGDKPEAKKLIDQFVEMGVAVHIKQYRLSDIQAKQIITGKIGRHTVLTAGKNFVSTKQIATKRLMDILGGLVGCIITVFLLIILAPVIYLHSPGPILFSQTRIGKNGRRFKIYKFRSMHMNAEDKKQELMVKNRIKDGLMFKLDYDPRIIGCSKRPNGSTKKGFGGIIRDLSIDEFPQFFNVLLGEMSLVGTRPPTFDEWGKYEFHHRARLASNPGITGMWQVSGRSNITDFEEVVSLDKKYIEEWKIWLDIKILLKTVHAVIRRKGSM